MTVDVEDYFQVSAFEHVVAPIGLAVMREPRLPRTPSGCSQFFDDASVRATFFVLGWVAERFPGLVRRIHRRRATSSRRMATRIAWSTP